MHICKSSLANCVAAVDNNAHRGIHFTAVNMAARLPNPCRVACCCEGRCDLVNHSNTTAATEFVCHDLCMCQDFVACPILHVVQAGISATRAFATAGGTPHHCANLSGAAFAVHSNMWAARFCSQRPCWFVLSRGCSGQACAALLAEGAITATTPRTLRSRLMVRYIVAGCLCSSASDPTCEAQLRLPNY